MPHHERRPPPREIRVGIPIEMDDIGLCIVRKPKEPVAGAADVVPGVVHPFQPEHALMNLDVREGTGLLALSGAQGGGPSSRESTSTPCAAEGEGQLEGVGPDPAEGVGRHQDTPRRREVVNAHARHSIQLRERQRLRLLNLAELLEQAQVVLVRPLPRPVVGDPPELRVVRRPGIREQRDRLVRPDAVTAAGAAAMPRSPPRRRPGRR